MIFAQSEFIKNFSVYKKLFHYKIQKFNCAQLDTQETEGKVG